MENERSSAKATVKRQLDKKMDQIFFYPISVKHYMDNVQGISVRQNRLRYLEKMIEINMQKISIQICSTLFQEFLTK